MKTLNLNATYHHTFHENHLNVEKIAVEKTKISKLFREACP